MITFRTSVSLISTHRREEENYNRESTADKISPLKDPNALPRSHLINNDVEKVCSTLLVKVYWESSIKRGYESKSHWEREKAKEKERDREREKAKKRTSRRSNDMQRTFGFVTRKSLHENGFVTQRKWAWRAREKR